MYTIAFPVEKIFDIQESVLLILDYHVYVTSLHNQACLLWIDPEKGEMVLNY